MDENRAAELMQDPRLAGQFVGRDIFLDVGCGAGFVLDWVAENYRRPIGIDVSSARFLGRDKPATEWTFILADGGRSIPLATGRVDVVFANQVIEHIYDPIRFASELHRILRVGGVAVITTPNIRYLKNLYEIAVKGDGPRTGGGETVDGPWDNGHLHYFTHSDVRFLFRDAGFRRVRSRALVDLQQGARRVRRILDKLAGTSLVREFLSGNILLVATK